MIDQFSKEEVEEEFGVTVGQMKMIVELVTEQVTNQLINRGIIAHKNEFDIMIDTENEGGHYLFIPDLRRED